MIDFDFSGDVGGRHSSLGQWGLAYLDENLIVVTWVGMAKGYDNNTQIMTFGYDDGGNQIALYRNTPTALTRVQAQRAISDGAIILALGMMTA